MHFKSHTILISVLLSLGGFFSSLADAATITVAKGTAIDTIAKGMALLTPGGTLIVNSGSYAEIIGNIPSGLSDSARTKVQANGAVICNGIDVYSRNYITVSGFTFNGYTNRIGRSSESNAPSTYITFENCIAQNWGGGGSGGGGFMPGFRQYGVSCFIRLINCSAHGNGSTSLDHGVYVSGRDITVQGGSYYGNSGHGIQVFASSGAGSTNNSIIQSVDAHDNGSFGIGLYSGASLRAIGNKVYNNGKIVSGSGQLRIAYGAISAVVQNNDICGSNPIVDNGTNTQQSNNTCGGVVIPSTPTGVDVGNGNPPATTQPPAASGGISPMVLAAGAGFLLLIMSGE
jgi:hypothetical protein